MLSDIDKNQYVNNIFIARYCFISQKIKDLLNIFHAWVKLNKHLCRQFLFQHQCTRIKTSPVNL